jgi:Na+-driven multidrug efflux pump
MGKTLPACIIGMARQGLILVPVVFIMPIFLGFLGVQIAQPISDVCALIIAIPFQLRLLKSLRDGDRITSKGR